MKNKSLNADCDYVLKIMEEFQAKSANAISNYAKIKDEKYNMAHVKLVGAILATDGFISVAEGWQYTLTEQGRTFLYTDSYVDRAQRWENERKIKEQELQLGIIELSFKRYANLISILSIVIASLGLIVACIALHKKA